MSCYLCGLPETKLCDGLLADRLINPQSGTCDRPMCDHHAKTVSTMFVCRRGKKGKSAIITRDLCPDCLAIYQSRKS
ncbi:MAG: hypothetical protein IM537_18780 [Pseudanabaena sp. M57BS1SP1A06MG]|nr:hypothetical protein [Pseudanabaena sp. M34BS1SP1A06MG]MCA6602195.1 hypothetical protein [Pseudanabaena sp. M57BS1SP1A06MG]